MTVDPRDLAATLRRLATRADDDTVLPAMDLAVRACAELFGATGSGLMIADEQNVLRYVASSDGPGRVLESAEAQYGQGPCTDSFVHNEQTWTDDIGADERWPLTRTVAEVGVRAVLGVPVRIGGVQVGSLDIYRDHPYSWDESERRALVRYGEVIGSALAASLEAERAGELAAQLQYALDNRVLIERAVGFLMATEDLDAVGAFNRLRLAARSARVKIGDVAATLLTERRLPG